MVSEISDAHATSVAPGPPQSLAGERQAKLGLLVLGAVLLSLCACGTAQPVDPEGFLCDPGGACPPGYLCSENVCRSRAAICAELPCNTPPATQCTDGSTLRTFAPIGTCVPEANSCAYTWTDRTCERGCADRACVGEDPCADVTCNAAPPPVCSDATTLTTYPSSGTCSGGTCEYAPTSTTCAHGCQDGACVGDLCAGITCNQPPAPTCSGTVLTRYEAGTCDANTGTCSYAPVTESCAFTCVAGACVNPPLSFAQVGPRLEAWLYGVDMGPTSAGNVVLVVGAQGFVARWDGTSWTTLPSGVTTDLYDVWLASDTVGYIVGASGVVLKYQNGTLTQLPSGTTRRLTSVHGAGQYVVALTTDGDYVQSTNGSTFTFVTGPSSLLAGNRVFVDPDDLSTRIAGRCTTTTTTTQPSCVAYRPFGGTWSIDRHPASSGFYGVGPSLASGVAYVSTSTGFARHHGSSGAFDTVGVPTGLTFTNKRVWEFTSDGAANPNVYVLVSPFYTPRGDLYRHSAAGGTTHVQSLYGEHAYLSRNYAGGVALVDGKETRSNIFRRGLVTNEALEVGMFDFVAADGLATRRVATDSFGNLVLADGGKSTFKVWQSGASTQSFNGVVLAGSYALIYGDGGTYRRWTEAGGHDALSTIPGTGDLLAGCRNSDTELYLVGAQGRIFRYDGAAVTSMPSGTTATLNAVVCTGAGEAFAVGNGGVVLRLWQGSWMPVTPSLGPNLNLTTAWASAGELYVGGDGVFAHYTSSAWTWLPSLPKLGSLRGKYGSELYAASGNSVVRFDGATWNTVFTAPQPLVGGALMGGTVSFVGGSGVIVEGK